MLIIPAHRKQIGSVCLSLNETLAASAEEGSSKATIWDLATETAVAQCSGAKRIEGLCFSLDDSILRVQDGIYPYWSNAWQSSGGERVLRLVPTEYEMAEQCRNRPLRLARSGTKGKERLKVWGDSWRTPQEIFGMPKSREVRRVGPAYVVGPNSHSGNQDIVIRSVIDTDPSELHKLRESPLDADAGRCWSAAITDDQNLVALGFDNGLVYLHDFAHDREVGRWNWEIGPIKALTFSPSGRMLIAGGKGAFAAWEIQPRQEPDENERTLLQAIAAGNPQAVTEYSDLLAARGVPRWDRYEWKSPRPLQMHARSLLRSGDDRDQSPAETIADSPVPNEELRDAKGDPGPPLRESPAASNVESAPALAPPPHVFERLVPLNPGVPLERPKLHEIRVSQAGLSKLKLYPAVYPYGFWVWPVRETNRQGGVVCFRGNGRSGPEGMRDVKAVHWLMSRFIGEVGGIDGLVVQMIEYFGDWHEKLTFVPASLELPSSFRVLYSVLNVDLPRATALWGSSRVRGLHDGAVEEMDQFLASLPPVERMLRVRTVSMAINIGMEIDQIDELVKLATEPVEITFAYEKNPGEFRDRRVTVQGASGRSLQCLDHADGKIKNFRLDRIRNARDGIREPD